MSLDDLYQELLLDHFRNPRCKGCIDGPCAKCLKHNPLCGDQVELSLKIENERIVQIAFSGSGCAISQASASMMTELCNNKSIQQVRNYLVDFKNVMKGEDPVTKEQLGDVLALEGVRKFSARIKCAMLAWEALEYCLEKQ